MASSDTYPPHPRATLNRLKARGKYDYATINTLINASPVLTVSFNSTDPSDPFPTALPMIGQMGLFSNPTADPTSNALDLYLHGHVAARLMRLPTTTEGAQGIPVCVSATHLDGYVLALTPFAHSMNYRSVVLHGYATAVTDPDEKMWALTLITDGVIPTRWDNSRTPPTDAEMKSTTVLKVTVASASAKVRDYGVGDERRDLKDEDVMNRVWSGVLPTYLHVGEPVPGENNRVQKVPAYIEEWRKRVNGEGERYSKTVAGQSKKK
ncbi:hypothetical protein BJ508DRAFT_361565 [Ascobolus immersus RN42]|uniref:5-nitroimidazole antibiotic resistance protein n=1 Tax=Ascobolus immersus RN42 TaxID=1160509 RepID=A0A3N4I790_ASCIM|nr:hypothetical protein BJ508DRAFT_361565 [Ascobolus immersus RN42]